MSGKAEGRFYPSKRKYAEQFSENLGFLPYPGTLNVKLDERGGDLGDVLCLKSKLVYKGKEKPRIEDGDEVEIEIN